MADKSFEMALERGFAEAPTFLDADLFALGVAEKLDRGWTLRRLVIGGLGLVGGLIGASQLLNTDILTRMNAFVTKVDGVSVRGAIRMPAVHEFEGLVSGAGSADGQFMWMVSVLAALSVGLFVARAIREI
jgi:hypothetical protein